MQRNRKCAVLSCLGLGDGLISLVLSHNLHLNNFQVTTFHPFLAALQGWFPHLPLAPFPEAEALKDFERVYIFYEKSPWMQKIMAYCQEHMPEKTCILNPIATPNCDYPYWENGRFDGRLPFVENLYRFCQDVLRLEKTTRENGITPPKGLVHKKYPKRVVMHPTSSKPGKNWPQTKFLRLAKRLEEEGFEPVFILTAEEKKVWGLEAPHFASLDETARFVYESGYMIGNDSGIGHLASCLGLPTLIICRSHLTAPFWRPDWTRGEILSPPKWVPNIKFLRWRDKHWKKFIPVARVFNSFRSFSA